MPAKPERLTKLDLRYRVPVCYQHRDWVSAGGLMSFGVEHGDPHGRVVALIDKILRGANPAELPFELPSKSDLTINRTTAATLGIEIPRQLLLLADEVFG
jgi:putative ABC transport system substrate-binding protein